LVLKSEGLAVYSPPGYLLTLQQGMLVAYPFDEKSATVRDRPQRVAESIPSGAPPGYAPIAVSANGLLAYSSAHLHGRELVWLDRAGKRLGTVGPAGDYSTPDVSPDEKRVAVSMREGSKTDTDVWLFDTVRAAWSRFTFDPTNDRAPTWSPDGTRILYASGSRGTLDLYEKPAGGAGEGRLVVVSSTDKFPSAWSRDGRFVVYHTFGGKTAWDVWAAPLLGGKPFPFLASRFTEVQGVISPNGRWMAYSSDESGRFETYVTEFPKQRGRWQLSTSGGMQPAWRADGRELFYVAPDQTFMSVGLRVAEGFEALPPVPLFKANFPPSVPAFWRYYVPSTDGKRFLVSALLAEAGASPINVVLNWTAALKK
jgi:dipeptidyl aminopeptidase/acylaminoacyl peptidase